MGTGKIPGPWRALKRGLASIGHSKETLGKLRRCGVCVCVCACVYCVCVCVYCVCVCAFLCYLVLYICHDRFDRLEWLEDRRYF